MLNEVIHTVAGNPDAENIVFDAGETAENNTPHFYLNRIILIDSYKESGITKLLTNGHTALTGGNGAGKTSLLRLIPVFYGESPRGLLRDGIGALDSFAEHYLPHSTSFIIYEYSRYSKMCMVVIHADGDGECYRFIDQPYSQDRFLDADGHLLDSDAFPSHIAARGEFCSRKIKLPEYKAIIQSDSSAIKQQQSKNDTKNSTRQLMGNFSFIGAGGRLQYIEKIVTGMFARATEYKDIRRVIASCIESDTTLHMGATQHSVEKWLSEYSAYARIMSHAKAVENLSTLNIEHTETIKNLNQVRRELKICKSGNDDIIRQVNAAIDDLESQRTQKEEKYTNDTIEINKSIANQNASATSIQSELNRIHDQHKAYQDDHMEQKAQSVDSLGYKTDELATIRQKKEVLIGDHSAIEAKFADMLRTKENDFHQHETDRHKKIKALIIRKESDMEGVRAATDASIKSIRDSFDKQTDELRDKTNALLESEAEAKISLKHPHCSTETESAKNTTEKAYGQARKDVEDAESLCSEAHKTHKNEEQQLQAIQQELDDALTDRRQATDTRKALLDLKKSEQDTLLYFLKHNYPDWTMNIAKVVPEDILTRTDLSPYLNDDGGSSLFGVGLDLDALETPDIADEDILQQRIDWAEQDIQKYRRVIEDKNAAIKKQKAVVSQTDKKAKEADIALSQAKNRLKIRNDELDSISRKRTAEIEKARSDAKLQADKLRGEIEKNNKEMANLRQQRTKMEKESTEVRDTRLKEIQDSAEKQVNGITKTGEDEKESLNKVLRSIEQERDNALKNNGVDTDSRNKMDADIAKLEKEIRDIKAYEPKVIGWRQWVQNDWESRHSKDSALNKHKSIVKQLEEELNLLNQQRTDYKSTISSAITAKKQEKENAEKQNGYINDRLYRLRDIPERSDQHEITYAFQVRAYADLEEAMRRLMETVKSEDQQIQGMVKPVLDSFNNAINNTSTYSFYDRERQDVNSVHHNVTVDEWMWVDSIVRWFTVEHVNVRRIVLNECTNIASGIRSYYKTIKGFQRKVSVFEHDLQRNIDESVKFRAINRIEVHLSMAFEEIEGWNDIQHMSELYDKWMESGTGGLPDTDLVDAIRRVNQWLRGRQDNRIKLENILNMNVEINEVGRPKKSANSAKKLQGVSSNGLSYLILCVIFVGLINKIRGNHSVQIVWALDELATLDMDNISVLLRMLEDNHIHLISAFPNADPDILMLTKNRYAVQDNRVLATFVEEVYDEVQ